MNTTKTLLDFERLPSMAEMKAFFRENDRTGVRLFDEKCAPELHERINRNKDIYGAVSKRLKRMRALFKEITGY